MSEKQRREVQEALFDAVAFEDLPGKWQAAILTAEQGRPNLRPVTDGVASQSAPKLARHWALAGLTATVARVPTDVHRLQHARLRACFGLKDRCARHSSTWC
jgi:hypothetical protein